MSRRAIRRVLILSVGYGEGHHAAARAMAQEFQHRGCETKVIDPCLMAHPTIFALTQKFYHFCVRKAPWMWAITYAQTDTADWSVKADAPVLRAVTKRIVRAIEDFQPDVVLCTYPLFAHMLDVLTSEGRVNIPYAVIVTDSIEISRPWMVTKAPLIFLPDEHSLLQVSERYALAEHRLLVTGFPVRREFSQRGGGRELPCAENLRLVYGAYAPLNRVRSDLRAIVQKYPEACVTVIAGERCEELAEFAGERVQVIRRTEDMPGLFAQSHFYIGKAGAATMFEAYASGLPFIVNYALPGQEQGNLTLLLLDRAGVTALSTSELMAKLKVLLADGAAGWTRLSMAMKKAARSGGAGRIADALEERFFV